MNKYLKLGLLLPFITISFVILSSFTFLGELILSFLPYAVGLYFVYMIVFSIIIVFSNVDIKRANTYWLNWLVVFMFFLGIFSFYFDMGVSATENENDSIKFISANIWYKNNKVSEMRSFFENENADVVMLTEFTKTHNDELQDYFTTNYKFHSLNIEELDFPYTGKVIFSKYPLKTKSSENNTYDELFLRNELEFNDKLIELVMVHTTAPVNRQYMDNRNDQLDYFKSEVVGDSNIPSVITGDFNVSPWSPVFITLDRHMSNNDLSRVHLNDFDYTWKYHQNQLLRSHIDHTYTSKGISTTAFEYKDFPGSDHKAQVFTLSVE